jgi:hypothetical protein
MEAAATCGIAVSPPPDPAPAPLLDHANQSALLQVLSNLTRANESASIAQCRRDVDPQSLRLQADFLGQRLAALKTKAAACRQSFSQLKQLVNRVRADQLRQFDAIKSADTRELEAQARRLEAAQAIYERRVMEARELTHKIDEERKIHAELRARNNSLMMQATSARYCISDAEFERIQAAKKAAEEKGVLFAFLNPEIGAHDDRADDVRDDTQTYDG